MHTDIRQKTIQTILLGVLVNVLLAATKGIAGVLGQSYALIADAMESTLDIFSSLVVWSALRISLAPPDEDHPYGHGKAEPLSAAVVALALIAAAVGLAIQSLRAILAPTTLHTPKPFTLVVLAIVIVIKETLFRLVFAVGTKAGSTAAKTDAWHHRSDALTSAAAFVGITVTLIGGKGYETADGWAALFACAIIGYNGYRLLRPAIAEVMDAAPDRDVEIEVRRIATSVHGVLGLDVCAVRKMGFDYFVDLHIEVDGDMSVRTGHEVAHKVKDTVRASNPHIRDVLIHVEPAGRRGKRPL